MKHTSRGRRMVAAVLEEHIESEILGEYIEPENLCPNTESTISNTVTQAVCNNENSSEAQTIKENVVLIIEPDDELLTAVNFNNDQNSVKNDEIDLFSNVYEVEGIGKPHVSVNTAFLPCGSAQQFILPDDIVENNTDFTNNNLSSGNNDKLITQLIEVEQQQNSKEKYLEKYNNVLVIENQFYKYREKMQNNNTYDQPNHSRKITIAEDEEDFLEDPDYVPNEESEPDKESEPNQGRPKKGRKRKYPEQNRQIRKKRANTNQRYINAKGREVSSREFSMFDCKCPKNCIAKLSENHRKAAFETFWSSGSFEARCALIQSHVRELVKSRSYSRESKRQFTRKYFLSETEVCKQTYIKSLNISQTRIDLALEKKRNKQNLHDARGVNSGGKNVTSDSKLDNIKQFLDGIPKYTSHYCRNKTTSKFLAPNLNLQILYDLYKEKYPDGVSLARFKKTFYQDFNLRFKKPQKDTCLRCDTYHAQKKDAKEGDLNRLEQEHKLHLDHAYSLRKRMKEDLNLAKTDPSTETLTFDLQKTQALPRLPTGIVYYKRQLNLHNLGIHCGSTGTGYFNIWLEHEAGRGTQEVGSCLRKYIFENLKPAATHLILWADSCGGQNRSIKMLLMLLHILQNHNKLERITIRFLQPGHTYLPNDSEFGDVECALKTHTRLYTDEDLMHIMRTCRRRNKFIVKRLNKNDFKSIAPVQNLVTNRKTDIEKNKISWLKTFEIELKKTCPTKLFMKSTLHDDPKEVDISKGLKGRKNKPIFAFELPLLWPDGRKLSASKLQDLKEMLKLVPTDSKPFYQFLKQVQAGDFIDDVDGFGLDLDFEPAEEEMQ